MPQSLPASPRVPVVPFTARAAVPQHGARRVAKPDPLREFMFRHVGKLGLATTMTFAIACALEQQKAEQDEDLALLLKRYVGDALAAEVETIDRLLQGQNDAEVTRQ